MKKNSKCDFNILLCVCVILDLGICNGMLPLLNMSIWHAANSLSNEMEIIFIFFFIIINIIYILFRLTHKQQPTNWWNVHNHFFLSLNTASTLNFTSENEWNNEAWKKVYHRSVDAVQYRFFSSVCLVHNKRSCGLATQPVATNRLTKRTFVRCHKRDPILHKTHQVAFIFYALWKWNEVAHSFFPRIGCIGWFEPVSFRNCVTFISVLWMVRIKHTER